MTTENRCGQCGKAIAVGDRFCAHCGANTTGARGEAAPGPVKRKSPWDAILERLQQAVAPKYRVKRVLGYGGMAGVYLAEEPKLGRRVAIKVMSPALMVDPKLVERFEQEARTIAQLNHPNIVTIYEVDERDDLHYFTMTYVAGRAMSQVMDSGDPLPFAIISAWLSQVAAALAYAHRAGVVHRDIKPGNVMLDEQGVVKILDIGVGHLRQSESNPAENTGELMMSAIAYMAPEHARGREVDARCDIYSLGGVLYYLLTGRAPFSTKTDAERATIKQSKRPLPIADLRADTPPALADLCERMMALKPEDRVASMTDVLAALASTDNPASAAAPSQVDTELAEAEPVEPEKAEPEVEAVAEIPGEKKTVAPEIKIGPSTSEPEDISEKAATPAFKIEVGDGSKPAAAAGPMDFAINTKKRRKKPAAKPVPPEKPAAEKTPETATTAAAADDAVTSDDKPEPAAAAPKKGLSKRLIIGGVCAAGLLLIAGIGLGAMMLLRGDREVAAAPAGTTNDDTATAGEPKADDTSTDIAAVGEAAEDASADPANPEGAAAAATAEVADPFAGGDAVAAASANAVEPASDAGDVAATESAPAAAPSESTEPAPETVTAKKEPVPDSPTTEMPADDKPTDEKPEPEAKPEPAKPDEKKAPPKQETFKFAAAIDLPTPEADAPELTLGQINIRPEDAVFISMDGGDIAAGGRTEFSLQNAQDGVAPRDWEFYLSEGSSDPVVIATMSMPEKDLKFKWTQAGVENQTATNLRNCSLKITAGQDQPQDVALRTPQKLAPVTIDVEKPATAKLTLEGAPDRNSLKMEVTVKGHKAFIEPAQIELGKGGDAVIYFGENQEQAAFALKLEASINARGIQIKTDPHFLVPGTPPVRLNKGSIKKYEAAQAEQAGLQSRIFEGEKAIKDPRMSPQDKARGQTYLADWKQRLELIDKTVAKMAQLSTDAPAIGSGASLQFRVFSDTFDKQIDLIVPDPNAAPVAP